MLSKSFLYVDYLITVSDALRRTSLQILFYAAVTGGIVKQSFW